MEALGYYIIVTCDSKTEKNTNGFEIVTDHNNKKTNIGIVTSVGPEVQFKLESVKVGDKVMYFDEEAVPIDKCPNSYVLRLESIFAKEEKNE